MPSRPEKILIVDDQTSVVQLCRRVLGSQGFETDGVLSGEEAVAALHRQRYDLLIVDLLLPGIDGLETFRRAKEMYHDLAGIVITGHGTKSSIVDAMKSGLYGFIEKPFTMQELKSTVEDVLSRYRMEKENVRLKALIPLFEVHQAMTSTHGLGDLYRLILDTALQEAKSERGSLMYLDDKANELYIVAAKGLPHEVVATARQKLGEGIAGLVAQTREPLILTDGQVSDPRFLSLLRYPGQHSAVCFPLLAEGKLVGVLNLNRASTRHSFSESDKDLLSILCGQAASAIVSARLNEDLRKSHLNTIHILAKAIEARDPYTQDHADDVSIYASRIAQELGMADAEIEAVRIAATLHDIGKIGIPESILLKPGRLTPEEFEEMKKHPEIGAHILKDAEFPWKVVPIVYHHQERYDGTGYPQGLQGEGIPLGARIISVCDTFQAIITDRAYRKGLPPEKAIEILREVSGTQLDGSLVGVFVNVYQQVIGKETRAQRSVTV